jgi:hypothetical protein
MAQQPEYEHYRGVGRTLVSVRPSDTYSWTQPPLDNTTPLIGPNGYEELLAYDNIVTASDIDSLDPKQEFDKSKLAKFQQALRSIDMNIPNDSEMSKEDRARQVKMAALALTGHWGDNVSISGLNPDVAKVMDKMLEHESLKQMNIAYGTTDEHPLAFAEKDGLVEKVGTHHGLKYPEPPNNLTKKDIAARDKQLKESFTKGKPKFEKVRQQQLNAPIEDYQKAREQRRQIGFD